MAGQKKLFNELAQFSEPQFLVESRIRTSRHQFKADCNRAFASARDSAETSKKVIEMLTASRSSFTASMLRDLFDAQRTEHDHILGVMIRKGHRLACPTPLLEVPHMHMVIQAIRATIRP